MIRARGLLRPEGKGIISNTIIPCLRKRGVIPFVGNNIRRIN
jgi:hypothetical protein